MNPAVPKKCVAMFSNKIHTYYCTENTKTSFLYSVERKQTKYHINNTLLVYLSRNAHYDFFLTKCYQQFFLFKSWGKYLALIKWIYKCILQRSCTMFITIKLWFKNNLTLYFAFFSSNTDEESPDFELVQTGNKTKEPFCIIPDEVTPSTGHVRLSGSMWLDYEEEPEYELTIRIKVQQVIPKLICPKMNFHKILAFLKVVNDAEIYNRNLEWLKKLMFV